MPSETLTLSELLKKDFPAGDYVIGDGLLSRNSILLVGGPPKAYKSMILNSILCNLATGAHLFGAYRTPRGHERKLVFPIETVFQVLYLEQEVGERDLKDRFQCHMKSLNKEGQHLCGQFISTHSCDRGLRLDTPEGMSELRKVIGSVGPEVVCFDPLVEFHAADENSASDMSRVMRNLDLLRQEFGFASILSHHTGKANGESGRHGPDRLRGSSVLFGKVDSVMLVDPDAKNEGLVKLSFTLRRGRPIPDCWVRVHETHLTVEFVAWANDPALKDKRNRARRPGQSPVIEIGAKLGGAD